MARLGNTMQSLQLPGGGTFLSRHAHELTLAALALVAFFLRLYICAQEPFLHDWDERFHALVARNLMDHPLQPMLKANPVIEQDRFLWCCNHIWLHKQPLFMWQMAASMKIFGVSELSARLPSILMGSLMVVLVYRIAVLLARDKTVALVAAMLLAFSHFHIEMISGIKGMDHNDVAMGFYTLASIWAWAQYNRAPKWYWALLVGVFAGCAILNKWLVGLFVFLCWGVTLLPALRKNFPRRELLHFALALVACTCIFLPWQLYILHRWPEEASYVYEFNRRHITEVLEGHSGTAFYYAATFPKYFSDLWFLAYIGLVLAFRRRNLHKKLFLGLGLGFIFVFAFFSFVVKTKVESHFFFVAPIFLIFMAIGIRELVRFFPQWYITVPLLLWIAVLSADPVKFKNEFSSANTARANKIHNTHIYKNLRQYLPAQYKVVMNLAPFEDIELMFYQNDITAYNWWFTEDQMKELEKKKVPIAVFRDHGQFVLPDYVHDYPYLFVIDQELK